MNTMKCWNLTHAYTEVIVCIAHKNLIGQFGIILHLCWCVEDFCHYTINWDYTGHTLYVVC